MSVEDNGCGIRDAVGPGQEFPRTVVIPGANGPQLFQVSGRRLPVLNLNAPCIFPRLIQMGERGMDPRRLSCKQCGADFNAVTPPSPRPRTP